MIEERVCYPSELPVGSVVQSDTYTLTGALLLKKHSVIDEYLLKRISSYHGKIKINVFVPDEEIDESVFKVKSNIDNSLVFTDSFKEYALDSISIIYNNLDDPNILMQNAIKLSDDICSLISSNENLELNLSALRISDEYTYKHSVNVGTMAAIIAARLNKSEQFIKDIGMAGILHDIGKSKIPDAILNKPARLTDDEFAIMKKHPAYGYQMLMNCDVSNSIRNAVLNHHENIDGSGYPRALPGEKICDMGKILSIADVFDALVSARPYKSAKTAAQAIEIMFGMSNKFDLSYFLTFLNIVNAYPNGSIVHLSNGEVCKVIEQNPSFPIRPIVCNTQNKVIDLSRDLDYLSVVIAN